MEKRLLKGISGEISLLGFGLMRLPLNSADVKDIDIKTAKQMIDKAVDQGVNYFDTAWVYHAGMSEVVAGKLLSGHPRDKYNLATKMPPWVLTSKKDLEHIFSEQLKKCQVDYFDFYLLHNIGKDNYQLSLNYDVYEFLHKKKEAGYIRYLGFSVHDTPNQTEMLVNKYSWDFAQIQLNYVDWIDIDAKRQYEILYNKNIPIVVMEPVRGGALANLKDAPRDILIEANKDVSLASWAMRYSASLPGIMTVLSGMSTLEQVEDNLKTFCNFKPLSNEERVILDKATTSFRTAGIVPCTNCRYCMDCPHGVNIPRVFAIYNHYRTVLASTPATAEIVFSNAYRTLGQDENASKCVACEACKSLCPQKIDISKLMQEISKLST